MHNLAEKIQTRIESLYDIKSNNNVGNFIRKEKKIKYGMHENKESGFSCRKVPKSKLENLIYIHPRVIKNLNENNPFKSLNKNNIADFLVLIKDVDYWGYVNTKFELEKTLYKFELELQTTVTEYWIAAGFMSNHKGRIAAKFMLNYNNLDNGSLNFLMINVFPQGYLKLDKNIDVDKLIKGEEYPIAYTLARIYCNYLTGKDIDLILFSLRKFRMLGAEEKVKYILRGRL